MVLEKVLGLCSSLFVGLVVARYLGPDLFGQLSYAFAWMAIGAVFAQAGLSRLLIASFVRDSDPRPVLGSALLIQSVGAVIGLVVAVAGAAIVGTSETLWLMALFMSGVVLSEGLGPYRDLAMSRGRAPAIALAGILVLIVFSAARLLAVQVDAPLSWFAILASTDRLLWGAAVYAAARSLLSSPSISKPWLRTLTTQGWPVLLANLSFIVYSRLDLLLLERLADTTQVGLYASTSRIASSFPVLAVAVAQASFPALIKLQDDNPAAYFRRHLILSSALGAPVLMLSVAAIWYGETVTKLLLGPQYSETGTLLMLQLCSATLMCTAVLRAGYLTAAGTTRWFLFTTFLSLLASFILNIFFIPLYGAAGACVSQIVTQFISLYALDLLSPKTRKLGTVHLQALLIIPAGLKILQKYFRQ